MTAIGAKRTLGDVQTEPNQAGHSNWNLEVHNHIGPEFTTDNALKGP
jgi:hypothetical protein